MKVNKKYITQSREPFFEIAKGLINSTDVVLDIGAGNGDFAVYCNKMDMYMVDGNVESVNLYSTQFKNYQHAILPTLPFKNNFFDIIHCSHVVEHLQPEILYQTIQEVDRCLKTDGYFIISAPLLSDFFYNDLSHIKPYNSEVFLKYLSANYGQNNLTRSKISSDYQKVKLVFRYKKEYIISGNFNFFISFILKVLKKIGICKYLKTGFTLVLKKQNN